MKGRYQIKQDYFGLFDDVDVICVTDSLHYAVQLCEQLNKSVEERATYQYYFEKTVKDVDDVLDYYPGESFADEGYIYDVKNLEEFNNLRLKKKRHPQKRRVE